MIVDFTPVNDGGIKLADFAQQFSVADLRAATNASVDAWVDVVNDLTDAQVAFEPNDPNAHDTAAKAGEENIGWSVAHLVLHVTASCEEWATFSSILARGIPYPAEPRLRYEPEWKTFTTMAQCLQRLEESRRMRLAYLDAWPDEPNLTVKREISERFVERIGEVNALTAYLVGLKHEVDHFEQVREAARQAREAFGVG
jgi:hypothetical protein